MKDAADRAASPYPSGNRRCCNGSAAALQARYLRKGNDLLGSVILAPTDVAGRVAREFAAACLAPLQSGKRNSKGESHLEACLPGIARIGSAFAQSLLGRLAPPRSERAARALQAAKNVPVTELFSWPNFDGA